MAKAKKQLPQKMLVLAAVAALVLAGGAFAWYRHSHKTTPAPVSQGTPKIDMSPATPAEVKDSDSHKVADPTPTTPSQTPPATKQSVTPVVVGAGQTGQQVSVRSYVSGVVENGGTCTFTFTNGSASFTKTVTGDADATTTKCPNLTLDTAAFSVKGQWSVKVSYTSTTSQGESSAITFEVQ